MALSVESLANLVIRPPRQAYETHELPGPEIRIGAKRFRREDCTLTGAEGRKLECSWFLPAGAASVLPCCVFLHGNSGCRLDAYDAVRVLLPMNVSVFCLDFGGSGRSEGDFVSLGVRESLDTEAVVAHLRASGRVSRIALWGRSMGAATALLYASRDPSIAALVLDSPFASLVRLMAELVHTLPLRFSVPSLLVRGAVAVLRHNIRRRAGFDIHALDVVAASRRCFVPALFAHGREDTFVPPAHSEALAASYSGQSSRVLFDGGHNSPRPQWLLDAMCIFLHNALLPPPTTTNPSPPPPPSAPARRTPARSAATPPSPAAPARRPASSQQVDKLLAMGFHRDAAEAALARCRGDADAAAALLVDDPSGLAGGGGAVGATHLLPPDDDGEDAALAAALQKSMDDMRRGA